MRLTFAKILGSLLALAGVLGGGFLSVAAVLYFEGGPSLVQNAMVRTHPPAEAGQRMIEIAAFSIGAGLGASILLFIFLHLGIARGFFTKAEAITILRGSRRPGNVSKS